MDSVRNHTRLYVTDRGRLCNNILQFGHVYAWARDNGISPIAMRFCYKYPWFAISSSKGHNWWNYLLAKYGAKLGLIPVVEYNSESISDEEKRMRENVILNSRRCVVTGWYVRHYDSFLAHIDEIRSLFAFSDDVMGFARKQIEIARKDKALAVGIHIRRGDYAKWHNGRFLYDDDQYIGLIRDMSRLAGQKTIFYICGNDPSLSREQYRVRLEDEHISIVFPDGNPAEDLAVLSQCDYLMGPPSTFTLVASMYRDIPLYWIKDPSIKMKWENFDRFAKLFRNII